MTVVCAWCEVVLNADGGPVSHGICGACSASVELAFYRQLLACQPRQVRRRRRPFAPSLPLPGFGALLSE